MISRLAAFYIFDAASGKLIAEPVYYDLASLVQQMQGGETPAHG